MNAGNDEIDEETQEMAALKQMAQTVESLEAEAKRMKAALAEAVQRAAENSRKRRGREVDKAVNLVRSKVAKIDSAVGYSIKLHKDALERCKAMATTLRGLKRNLGAAKSEAVDGDKKRLDSLVSAVNELWNAVEKEVACSPPARSVIEKPIGVQESNIIDVGQTVALKTSEEGGRGTNEDLTEEAGAGSAGSLEEAGVDDGGGEGAEGDGPVNGGGAANNGWGAIFGGGVLIDGDEGEGAMEGAVEGALEVADVDAGEEGVDAGEGEVEGEGGGAGEGEGEGGGTGAGEGEGEGEGASADADADAEGGEVAGGGAGEGTDEGTDGAGGAGEGTGGGGRKEQSDAAGNGKGTMVTRGSRVGASRAGKRKQSWRSWDDAPTQQTRHSRASSAGENFSTCTSPGRERPPRRRTEHLTKCQGKTVHGEYVPCKSPKSESAVAVESSYTDDGKLIVGVHRLTEGSRIYYCGVRVPVKKGIPFISRCNMRSGKK